MIRNNHAREGGRDGDKEAKRDGAGRLFKSDRIYCLDGPILDQKRYANFFRLFF